MKKIIILLAALTLSQKLYCDVRIACTAALIDKNFDERKKEYIKALEILASYGYKNPFIIEAIKPTCPTFLDNYSENIVYTNVNNSNLRNKGVNEAQSLLEAFKKFNFNDDDMIVKITGRYFFTSNEFLQIVENHPAIDVFIKFDAYGQVFTGCFALRYKYFKEFLSKLDLGLMEKNMINIEWELAQYIEYLKINGIKIMKLEKLNLTANIFGNGNPVLFYW